MAEPLTGDLGLAGQARAEPVTIAEMLARVANPYPVTGLIVRAVLDQSGTRVTVSAQAAYTVHGRERSVTVSKTIDGGLDEVAAVLTAIAAQVTPELGQLAATEAGRAYDVALRMDRPAEEGA